MPDKRVVEVFTAGCSICDDVVQTVEEMACDCCDVRIQNTRDTAVAHRAKELGVARVPAVVINGKLVDCCAGGIDTDTLKAAGLGQPLN